MRVFSRVAERGSFGKAADELGMRDSHFNTPNGWMDEGQLIRDAHKLGLVVHPYTFRNEAKHLAANFMDKPAEEYRLFFAAGVDGVFTDYTDTALATRSLMQQGQ